MTVTPSAWFDDDAESVGTAAEFVAALRTHAPRLACDPDDTWALAHEDEVRAYVEIGDSIAKWVLFAVRAELVGDRLRCDELNTHNLDVLEQPLHFAPLELHGSAGELAEAAADWFEAVLNRPVLHTRWSWGERTVEQWTFTDNGARLLGGPLPPRFPPDVTVQRRHIRGTVTGPGTA